MSYIVVHQPLGASVTGSVSYPYYAGRLPYTGPVYAEVSAGNAGILSGAQSHACPADLQFALVDLFIARLGKLPTSARLPLELGHEMTVVHGSPADPMEAMSPEMDDNELSALLGDDPGDVVVCGASHVAFQRTIGDVRIVSVGSVGESPAPGFAHATSIEATAAGIGIEQFDVEI